jgi:hypothetical protein
LPILHALTGTILIDQPLSAYRLHGANDFSTLPSLHGLLSAHPKVRTQSYNSYKRVLIWLVDQLDIVTLMVDSNRYWQVLSTASTTHPYARRVFADPEFQDVLARLYPRLVELFGELQVFYELRRRLFFSEYLKIVFAARGHKFPVVELGRVFRWEFIRKCTLLYRKIV